jgi:hypothetical protein
VVIPLHAESAFAGYVACDAAGAQIPSRMIILSEKAIANKETTCKIKILQLFQPMTKLLELLETLKILAFLQNCVVAAADERPRAHLFFARAIRTVGLHRCLALVS